MKTLLAALALTLATVSAAMAFDTGTQDIIDQHKRGKPIAIADLTHLMQTSEQWCYDNQDNSCAWSEIYLDVAKAGASFELSNTWDETTNYAFTNDAVFNGNKICETGFNWIANLRAMRSEDGGAMGGRALRDFKIAMAEARPDLESYDDCFDYLFVSSDPEQDTVTLRQRQYADGVHDPLNDVEVTVYFDTENSKGLTLRL